MPECNSPQQGQRTRGAAAMLLAVAVIAAVGFGMVGIAVAHFLWTVTMFLYQKSWELFFLMCGAELILLAGILVQLLPDFSEPEDTSSHSRHTPGHPGKRPV